VNRPRNFPGFLGGQHCPEECRISFLQSRVGKTNQLRLAIG
jgi:hypothetical protein